MASAMDETIHKPINMYKTILRQKITELIVDWLVIPSPCKMYGIIKFNTTTKKDKNISMAKRKLNRISIYYFHLDLNVYTLESYNVIQRDF